MIAAVLASAFAFRGGDLGELARKLSAWSHEPSVALIQSIRPAIATHVTDGGASVTSASSISLVKPFAIESLTSVGDGKDLVRLLRVKAGVAAQASPQAIALWDSAWELNTLLDDYQHGPLPDGWTSSPKGAWTIGGGKATFALKPNTAVRMSDLAALGWSKPVKPHWLIGKMWVVPVAEAADERTVLRALAAATCGKLVEKADEYQIDLDPKAFRLRAQARQTKRFADVAPGTVGEIGAAITLGTWDWIGDDTIRALYAKPLITQTVDVPVGTPLYTALQRYADYVRKAESASSVYPKLLEQIDWSRPPMVFVTQGTGISPGWWAKRGGTIIL